MVNFCVHKNLLFHYCSLSLCIVMCKIYMVSFIVLLFVFIVSNIDNEQNVVLINVTINILLFLDVYQNKFNPLYYVVFFYVDINYKLNWYYYNIHIVI
jgi:hypothetical protein